MKQNSSVKDTLRIYSNLDNLYEEIQELILVKKKSIFALSEVKKKYFTGKINHKSFFSQKKLVLGSFESEKHLLEYYNNEIYNRSKEAQKLLELVNFVVLEDKTISKLLDKHKNLKDANIDQIKSEIIEDAYKTTHRQTEVLEKQRNKLISEEKRKDKIRKKKEREKEEMDNIKYFFSSIVDSVNTFFNKKLKIYFVQNSNLFKEKTPADSLKALFGIEKDSKSQKQPFWMLPFSLIQLLFFLLFMAFGAMFSFLNKKFLSNLVDTLGGVAKRYNKENKQKEENYTIEKIRLKQIKMLKTQAQEEKMKDKLVFFDDKAGLTKFLSQLSPVSNHFVRKISSMIVSRFPDLFKMLYNDLRASDINILYVSYLSISIFVSMLLGVINFVIINIVLPFSFTFDRFLLSIGVFFLAFGITFGFFMINPKTISNKRKKNIDRNLPFGLINVSAMVGSGANLSDVFKSIAYEGDLGEFSKEFEKLYKYIQFFGYDVTQAIKSVSVTTPSERLRDFLEGFLSNFETGGDLKVYMRQKTEDVILQYELNKEKSVQQMSTISDIYTAIMIAAPLFLVAILSMVGMLGGEIGGLPVGLIIRGGTYLVIPALNVAFIIFISSLQDD